MANAGGYPPTNQKLATGEQTYKEGTEMVRRISKNRSQGFTLIELLVVVIIIGILAAIALPNFIGAQDKAREASVKANMRTAQIAAESYATDEAGQYPKDTTGVEYQSYFPGGGSDMANAGKASVNPFTNVPEFPIGGSVANVQTARAQDPNGQTVGSAGQVEYSPIPATNPTAYAIRGARKTGKALPGSAPGTTLVLSNQ